MRVYRTKGGYFYKELKNGKRTRISKEQYQKLRKKQKGKGIFSTTHKITGNVNSGGYMCSCGENLGEIPVCPKAPVKDIKTCECSRCSGGYSLGDPKTANFLCRCCGLNISKECSSPEYTTWAKINEKCGSTKTWKATNLVKTKKFYPNGTYKVCSKCKTNNYL